VGVVVGLVASAGVEASAAPLPVVHERFVVAIDPGHGGTNQGCLGGDGALREKELTLDLALTLRDQLEQRLPHATVILTRETDVTMTLSQRVEAANAVDADLFLSIHANASPHRDQTGYETYVLDIEASTLEAARTASRENDGAFAAPAAVSPVLSMVRELAFTANRRKAAEFAQMIQRAQGFAFPQRVDRGVRQGPFDVLMGVRMPAVLHEVGFLDHAVEGASITEEAGRAKLAGSLATAVVEYYRTIERRE
jgi:N-acetylmuramoyl-L-alanine amidase